MWTVATYASSVGVTQNSAWLTYRTRSLHQGVQSRRAFEFAWRSVQERKLLRSVDARALRRDIAHRLVAHLFTAWPSISSRQSLPLRYALANIGMQMLKDADDGLSATIVAQQWLARRLGVSRSQAIRILKNLELAKVLVRVKQLPGGGPIVWKLRNVANSPAHQMAWHLPGFWVDRTLVDGTDQDYPLTRLFLSANSDAWRFGGLSSSAFMFELSRGFEDSFDIGRPARARRDPAFAECSTVEDVLAVITALEGHPGTVERKRIYQVQKVPTASTFRYDQNLERDRRSAARGLLNSILAVIGYPPLPSDDDAEGRMIGWTSELRTELDRMKPGAKMRDSFRPVLVDFYVRSGWRTKQAEALASLVL